MEILEHTENFIHVRSDVVPDWVLKLEIFRQKIIAALDKEDPEVKFCHPLK
jgi:hypothetical protein